MNIINAESLAETVTDGEVERVDSLLTAGEAACMLNVHINTIRRWNKIGVLPSFRIGPRGDRRFRAKDLMAFLLK